MYSIFSKLDILRISAQCPANNLSLDVSDLNSDILKFLWACDNDNIGFSAHWFSFVLILTCIFYVMTLHIPFQSRCGAALSVLICCDKETYSRNGILGCGSHILRMKMSSLVPENLFIPFTLVGLVITEMFQFG